MFRVKVLSEFAASHHLRNYNGKCENRHGHNWKIEVSCEGPELDDTGLLIDFKILKSKTNEILDELDHFDLNELEPFKVTNPSSENIAKFLYKRLSEDQEIKERAKICEVSVWENDRSRATYYE